jgi:hypothetical protein
VVSLRTRTRLYKRRTHGNRTEDRGEAATPHEEARRAGTGAHTLKTKDIPGMPPFFHFERLPRTARSAEFACDEKTVLTKGKK